MTVGVAVTRAKRPARRACSRSPATLRRRAIIRMATRRAISTPKASSSTRFRLIINSTSRGSARTSIRPGHGREGDRARRQGRDQQQHGQTLLELHPAGPDGEAPPQPPGGGTTGRGLRLLARGAALGRAGCQFGLYVRLNRHGGGIELPNCCLKASIGPRCCQNATDNSPCPVDCWIGRSARAPKSGSLQAAHHLDIQVLDLLAQGVAVETEEFRGLQLIAASRGERQLDQRPFDLPEHPVVEAAGRQFVLVGGEVIPQVPLDAVAQRSALNRCRRAARRWRSRPAPPPARRGSPRRRWFPGCRAPPAGGPGSPARARCPARCGCAGRPWRPRPASWSAGLPTRPGRKKWRTSSGMSSVRSRSGGRRIGTTLRR